MFGGVVWFIIEYTGGLFTASVTAAIGVAHFMSRRMRIFLGRWSFASPLTDADDLFDQLMEKRFQIQEEALARLKYCDPCIEVQWSTDKPRIIEIRNSLDRGAKCEMTGWIPVVMGKTSKGERFRYIVAKLDEAGEWKGTSLVGDHPAEQPPRELMAMVDK